MKKTFITILCVLVFALILTIVIVNFSSLKYSKDLKSVEETFQKVNKDTKISKIETYYGDKTYYIIYYKKNNKNFISVLDDKNNKILEIEKTKLFNLKGKKTLGYKNDKLIYEVKKSNKDGFTYSYYDAITGEFIKNIKLGK